MALPIATTTISVLRQSQDGTLDALDLASEAWAVTATGIRAVIGSPAGSEVVAGGSSETVTARLNCDPVSLHHGDRIYDEHTGRYWHVSWTARRDGLGHAHVVADLLAVADRTAV